MDIVNKWMISGGVLFRCTSVIRARQLRRVNGCLDSRGSSAVTRLSAFVNKVISRTYGKVLHSPKTQADENHHLSRRPIWRFFRLKNHRGIAKADKCSCRYRKCPLPRAHNYALFRNIIAVECITYSSLDTTRATFRSQSGMWG